MYHSDLDFYAIDEDYAHSPEFACHKQIEDQIILLAQKIESLQNEQRAARKIYVNRTSKYAITREEIEKEIKDQSLVDAICIFLENVKNGENEHCAFNGAYLKTWRRQTNGQKAKFRAALGKFGINPAMRW